MSNYLRYFDWLYSRWSAGVEPWLKNKSDKADKKP